MRAALEGVDARQAAARPEPAAHTICEIVLHMTAWTREVTRRLRMGIAQEPELGDWPTAVCDEGGWAAILATLDAANQELVDTIAALDDAQLRIGSATFATGRLAAGCRVMSPCMAWCSITRTMRRDLSAQESIGRG